ncbi:hypothetical protein LNQ52_24615 [Klebsiella pneumoniae subsp. pneumoniae]|nr:hypothetical protein [Klebsiella pneumoniae subsp. pneumoniae]
MSEAHFPPLVALTHQICRNLSQVAAAEPIPGRPFQPPYPGDYRLRQPRTGALCRARRAGSAPQ